MEGGLQATSTKLHVNLPSKQSSCPPTSFQLYRHHPGASGIPLPGQLHSLRVLPLQTTLHTAAKTSEENKSDHSTHPCNTPVTSHGTRIKSQLLLWPPRASELWPPSYVTLALSNEHTSLHPALSASHPAVPPAWLFLQTLTTTAHCHSGGARIQSPSRVPLSLTTLSMPWPLQTHASHHSVSSVLILSESILLTHWCTCLSTVSPARRARSTRDRCFRHWYIPQA